MIVGKVYLINLKRRPDRLKACGELLDYLKIPYEVFEAIDGIKYMDNAKNNIKNPELFHPDIVYKISDMIRDVNAGILPAGHVGCWMSHLIIYMEIVKKA